MTPKRADATCLMAERRRSPFGSGVERRRSSPPSPEFERPPIRFMAIASVSWASWESAPSDIAPLAKRFTISETGSTSSSGTGSPAGFTVSSERSVPAAAEAPSTASQ